VLHPSEAQLAATAQLQRVRRELGAVACSLLTALLIEDLCWADLAKRLKRDPKTGRVWVIEAIGGLAQVW
jgi:hypothetical protein